MKFSRNCIVVADDNRSVLTAVSLLLRPFFERVVTLTSPVHLLAVVKAESPDSVLLDMNFKSAVNNGNEGLYWLGRLRESSPAVPVVLFTAYADIRLAVQGIKAGAAEFVVKPWDNRELIDTLLRVSEPTESGAPAEPAQADPSAGPADSLAAMERGRIERAIVEERGNMTRVAIRLGISRQTLYNKIKRYGL